MKKKILEQCLQIAKSKNTPDLHPDWGSYHHFSFVIQNNKIVEWGTNKKGAVSEIHGFSERRHKIHSEVDAARKAKGLLNRNKPFDIVNIRLSRASKIRKSAPCKCCTSFLSFVGCNKVHYTTDEGWETCKIS